jgi:hypothetical protein
VSHPSALLKLDGLLADSDGRGVFIALVDGPVDRTHPDFAALDLRELDGSRGCVVPASPGCGHGTFVAGILGARRGGSAPGLCPASTLLVRPIFCEHPDLGQCPLVTVGELAKAVREAVDAGARVVNLSVGLSGGAADPAPLYAAYDYARERGALVVVAAGNHGTAEPSPLLLHPWPIGVAAADAGGRPVARVAPAVADRVLLAPGVEVTSTAPGKGYRSLSGTSAAAPFVAGAIALLWGLYPDADPATLRAAVLGEGEPGSRPRLLDAEASRRRLRNQIEAKNREITPMTDILTSDPSVAVAEPSEAPPHSAVAPASAAPAAAFRPAPAKVVPQGAGPYAEFVYAIGHVKAAFPSLDVEKEFQQVARSLDPPVDPYDIYAVLTTLPKSPSGMAPVTPSEMASEVPPGRFLADYLCWVFVVGNVDTYILKPRAPAQMDDMIGALKVPEGAVEPPYITIIGPLGPPAPASLCRGLQVPMVLVNQVYYFDYKKFYDELQGKGIEAESIQAVLKALEMKPNPGVSDRDRALNYAAFRYPEIYKRTAQLRDPNQSPEGRYYLKSMETRPSSVQGTRRIVDIIFHYQNTETQEEMSFYTSVDVTGQFPFLNSALRPFIPDTV